jgi:hypothetical protein
MKRAPKRTETLRAARTAFGQSTEPTERSEALREAAFAEYREVTGEEPEPVTWKSGGGGLVSDEDREKILARVRDYKATSPVHKLVAEELERICEELDEGVDAAGYRCYRYPTEGLLTDEEAGELDEDVQVVSPCQTCDVTGACTGRCTTPPGALGPLARPENE